jgi:hypothetical protein
MTTTPLARQPGRAVFQKCFKVVQVQATPSFFTFSRGGLCQTSGNDQRLILRWHAFARVPECPRMAGIPLVGTIDSAKRKSAGRHDCPAERGEFVMQFTGYGDMSGWWIIT